MTNRNTIDRRTLLLSAGAVSVGASATQASADDLPPEQLMSSADRRFAHDNAIFGEVPYRLTGYYYPETDIQAGTFRLRRLDISNPAELIDFEENGPQYPGESPFQFLFEDLTSTRYESDHGAYRGNTPFVLPSQYRITRDTVRFEGFDPQVGRVRFRGHFKPSFLAAPGDGDFVPAVTGTLTVNDKVFRNLEFAYSADLP